MSVKTDNFINRIAPMAVRDMQNTRVLASLTIAQAILESGWGESVLAKDYNNLFGIKATITWSGKVIGMNGANWRAYDSWDESILDHSELLQTSRYTKVLQAKDYKEACEEVRLAGYCTEADYSQKLIKLIEQYDLAQYDTIVEEPNKEEVKPIQPEPQQEMYRVRLNWEDSKSQIGAYQVLENAKKKVEENPDYKVFNSKGEVVYQIEEFKPYLVKITGKNIPVYKNKVDNNEISCYVNNGEVFTVVEECGEFLKLKSGSGWLIYNEEYMIKL